MSTTHLTTRTLASGSTALVDEDGLVVAIKAPDASEPDWAGIVEARAEDAAERWLASI